MPGSNGGLQHRMVRGIEPGRGTATVLHLVVVAVLVVLLVPPDQRPDPLPAISVPGAVRPYLVAFAALAVIATLVHAARWVTQQRILRMTRDPALRAMLAPVETEPTGPFAPPQPPPDVRFDRTPRWFARLPQRRRVTRERNVIGRPPLQIVYLRVFDNRPRARTFARGAWREFGYVQLLRSAASVGPGELARYRREGHLDELLVASDAEFRHRLDSGTGAPHPPGLRWLPTIAGSAVLTVDRYGAYPVRSVLCHGSFWTTALDILLECADLVVLDLSGYHTKFQGTQFELQRIVDAVPVERVVLLADPFSSRRFLREQVRLAWGQMAAGSPNAGAEPRRVQGYVTDWYLDEVDERGMTLRRTLRASRTQSRWILSRTSPPDGRLPDTGSHGGSGRDAGPWPWRRGAVALGALAAIAAAALLVGPALAGAGVGTSAAVVPGRGYVVRSGPSTGFPELAALPAGTSVRVECLQGNWARLLEPVPGGYLYREGLDLASEPSACP